ncbi:MAG TPA: FAD-binding oxidoreductase [Terriglobales bacterium]
MSATATSLDVVRELRAICGEEYVVEVTDKPANIHEDPNREIAARFFEHSFLVATPASTEEVSAILRLANERSVGIFPVGGRTNCYPPPRNSTHVVLSTSRLTEVEHYDPADLTVGVGAGMTLTRLNEIVGADQLMFAADPPYPERATVGGLLATASHGPMRHGYGGVRDFCIGVRFVTGDGRRAKGGGRVVKNVAGYDLMKLLIGSYGTLAVITSASFKLFPAPRQTKTFLAEFASAAEALKFRDLILHSPLSPMCLELVSPGARKLMRPEMTSDAWVICVRAAGSYAVLARYRKELGSAVTRELEGEKENLLWRKIEDCGLWDCIDVTVPTSEVAGVLGALDDAVSKGVAEYAALGRIGLGHVRVVTDIGDFGGPSPTTTLISCLRDRFQKKISLTVVTRGVNPWPITAPHPASMRAVKQALDPNNVLRGREIF